MNLPYQAGYYWVLIKDYYGDDEDENRLTPVVALLFNNTFLYINKDDGVTEAILKQQIVSIGPRLEFPNEFLKLQQLNSQKCQKPNQPSSLKKDSSPRRLRLGT